MKKIMVVFGLLAAFFVNEAFAGTEWGVGMGPDGNVRFGIGSRHSGAGNIWGGRHRYYNDCRFGACNPMPPWLVGGIFAPPMPVQVHPYYTGQYVQPQVVPVPVPVPVETTANAPSMVVDQSTKVQINGDVYINEKPEPKKAYKQTVKKEPVPKKSVKKMYAGAPKTAVTWRP